MLVNDDSSSFGGISYFLMEALNGIQLQDSFSLSFSILAEPALT